MPTETLKSLGELTEHTRPICYGVLKPGPFDPDGVPLIRVCDISSNRFDDSSLYRISRTLDEEFRRSRLRGGEILLSIQGTVGRVAVCPKVYAGANISRTIALIDVDRTWAEPRYVYWHLRHIADADGFWTVGTTRASLNIGEIRRIKVPLPPLAEQKRIADVLDKADALRANRRQALATLDTLLQSVFLDMFGDPVTNSKGWPIVTVESLLAPGDSPIRTGPFGSQLLHSEFVTEGIPVLGIENVVTNEFRWTEPRCLPPNKYRNFTRYRVFPGDVLVTIMGTVGRVCVAPDDLPECMSTKHLCVLTLDQSKVVPFFLWAAFLHDSSVRSQMRMAGKGAIMEGWNSTTIRNLRVKLPPASLQREFAQFCQGIRRTNGTLLKHRETIDTLFASLQSAAFAGTLFSAERVSAADSKPVGPTGCTRQVGPAIVLGSSEGINASTSPRARVRPSGTIARPSTAR